MYLSGFLTLEILDYDVSFLFRDERLSHLIGSPDLMTEATTEYPSYVITTLVPI